MLRIIITVLAMCQFSFAQQPVPSPSPQRTGRSYNIDEIPKAPPQEGPRGQSPVTFTDITSLTKIDFKHAASSTPAKYLLETMGGGVAIFDYDNDGKMDLFFTNGALLKEGMSKDAAPEKSDPVFWNRLYHQKPDGTFEDVTVRAGLKGSGYSMGVAAGDFDNDGNVDLYVTGYGENHLYRNTGSGVFAEVTAKAGVAASGWSTSAAWLDYDRDGRLDLFVARYLDWDFEKGSILCGDSRGTRAYCHPENFKSTSNILFHQRSNGTFEDVSTQSGIAAVSSKALGVAIADFDNDGFIDIFVANDSVRQQLYHNKGNGAFEDIALEAGAGYDEDGKTFAGMGVDAADFDNDGYVDVFCTTLSYQTYPLYRNNGDLSFSYVTKSMGVGQISMLYSGWGTHFIDADNDGLRDIFVAQSHVLDTIEKSTGYIKYKEPPLLMRNLGKTFVNVSASAGGPFSVSLAARGSAFGDLNNDGQIDIVLGVVDGPPVIFRNDGTRNHWLGIKLIGSQSNRDAIGARVTITDTSGRKIYDVSTSGSYLSASDPRIIVGLGATNEIRALEVRWPSGRTQSITGAQVDRYITVAERDLK